jgi:hypothetical protein
MKRFDDYSEFYRYYLEQHSTSGCRVMHVVGSSLVLLDIFAAIVVSLWLLVLAPVLGYGFAWIGHYAFEHNRPATFEAPFWSFLSDWRMYWETLTGRLPLHGP